MEAWTFDSRGPDETLNAGRELGRSIGADGLVIALVGPLGAGKTVFVKGLAEGLGVDPRLVSSPTFVIAQQYVVPEGAEVLHHIDLYRLDSEDELEAIGFYDMFVPGAVLAAEWADRFPGVLGREVLSIEFEGPTAVVENRSRPSDETVPPERGLPVARPGSTRTTSVTAQGEAAQQVLSDWADRLARSERPPRGDESRPGTGSYIEMRLGVTILLALALWLTAQLDLTSSRIPPCHVLIPSRSDELGTLRAECLVTQTMSGQTGLSTTAQEFEGVGALLVGRSIDLNRAGESLLETLPGIGVKRAEAIVRERRERPFGAVAELERVPGIGPRTRARLERWLHVERPPAAGVADDG